MKFETTWTGNWENAFHGLRHPMESYAKSDSEFGLETLEYIREKEKIQIDGELGEYVALGSNDLDLAQRMIKAGSPNDKFLRQIFVSVDITAPLYFWKEMDQYKVGTTTNSTSTMHKLASTPITLDCFETDDYDKYYTQVGAIVPPKIFTIRDNKNIEEHNDWAFDIDQFPINALIPYLEKLRQKYLETKDVRYWKELIRWLPESWLQTRTWTADYAVLRNIIHWRSNHKLTEWHQFVDWCRTLPYGSELLFYNQSLEK